MRICIDLDGVICELKKEGEKYEDLKPIEGAVETIRKLKDEGHYIIIYTARHMKTCNGNIYEVIAKIGKITLKWLEKHQIPYDEIVFGKPWADIYIDDNAFRFNGWENFSIENLPKNREKIKKEKIFTFVIPMAGKGERFLRAGYKIPKYMIEINGRTLFEYSLESLPLDIADIIIFIGLEEHDKKYNLRKFIQEKVKKYNLKSYEILLLKEYTRGQAETVYKARDIVDPNSNLSIYNIDTYFYDPTLKYELLDMQYDGVIGGFFLDHQDEKWSFAKVNYNMLVTKVAEKEQISNIALTGFYNFSDAHLFFYIAEKWLKEEKTVRGEFYIAPMYNDLIEHGKKFKIKLVEEFIPLGTPDDIESFRKKINN